MKILVLKTDCLLNESAKENIREEAMKAAQAGIMILDGGLDLEVIEIDKSSLLDEKGIAESFEQAMKKAGKITVDGKYVPYKERKIDAGIKHGIEHGTTVKGLGIPVLMTKEEAENLEPQTLEDPPLLQITLKDIHSVPEVIHNGETLKGLIDVDINWKTGGLDKFGAAYVNLRTAGEKGKRPSERRIEYKRGDSIVELPTKDDLVWDKERGVYILQTGNMK
ncbi:hypothetical protein [Bacillus safensis]|uniref:hypothetical protein n=1 Tax=Bacillus safensis TaxID=561879 RepID=UPI0022819DEE|nr:hypothetical protein [Bacillus safensis]MCY7675721.1 hypothetical protein [Bacillus safensis]MCY7699786.1 hypothetical protein [Bacillus safensis]MEC3628323.1 hypothetical protein [Bacillus safensis]